MRRTHWIQLDAAMSLVSRLQSLLGPAAVLTTPHDVEPHATDWRGRYRGNALCVAFPSSTDEVSAIVRAATEAKVAIVPQGGNTSLCEGAVPRAGGSGAVVLNLSRMHRIRRVDPGSSSMEVDAGCVLAAVQQAAEEHGLLYPVSLGAEGSCQIGGTIATNAGGTGVLRYGNTRDNVLGLEVVLPDGRIWNGMHCMRKVSTGPDLKHLFIGSEGTLGVITGATLKLHPQPTACAMAWAAMASPEAALAMLERFRSLRGNVLSAYELMNSTQLLLIDRHVPARRIPLDATYPWHILVELADGGNEEALNEQLQATLAEGFEAGLLQDAVLATSGSQRASMWEVRHSVSEANRKAGIGINTDCALPVSALPAFIERATAAAHKLLPGAPIIVATHMGDGTGHFIPLASFQQWQSLPDPEAFARAVKHAIHAVAHELSGTFSSEHGVGQVHTHEMESFKPAAELDMLRGIKALLDPANLFNPGRLLPAPSTPAATGGIKETA